MTRRGVLPPAPFAGHRSRNDLTASGGRGARSVCAGLARLGRGDGRMGRWGERRTTWAAIVAIGAVAGMLASPLASGASSMPFLDRFATVSKVASTVPPDGDVNPYGVAVVPQTMGRLTSGDTLVSNFNASSNLQGTGTTIVEVSPGGAVRTFARIQAPLPGPCPGGVGLTTALTVLPGGWVVVGSLPVSDAGTGTPKAGCLIVLDDEGNPVQTWSGGPINGPWDLTATTSAGSAEIFVTNVLDGTVAAGGATVDKGTVVRIDVLLRAGLEPQVVAETVVGRGFAERTDPSALVVGPTGVALAANDTLYVADAVNSRIASIPSALTRTTAVSGGGITLTSGGDLSGPLGLALAPDGDIVAANGGNGDAVEVAPTGTQVTDKPIDPADAAGDLFGITIAPHGRGLLFVDDGDNTLQLLHNR